jgi:hypothetical protein
MILSTAALSEVGHAPCRYAARYAGKGAFFSPRRRTMTTKTGQRYRWVKPSDLPDRVELIDTGTNHAIAEILRVGRMWQWRRKTTLLLHGAPPADGVAKGLTQAKVKVLDGMPDE